jgi:hypothetical protein
MGGAISTHCKMKHGQTNSSLLRNETWADEFQPIANETWADEFQPVAQWKKYQIPKSNH